MFGDREIARHRGPLAQVIALSSDGNRVAAASADAIEVCNVSEQRCREVELGGVSELAFSSTGRYLVARTQQERVIVVPMIGWSLPTMLSVGPMTAMLCTDNDRVVIAGRDGFARLWSLSDQRLVDIAWAPGVRRIVWDVALRMVVTGSEEGDVRYWKLP